jgi:hypothetical protein
MSVEEFRRKLRLEEKYSRFSSLRARVIDQAQEELREKADVYFTYRVVREGRTPKRLEFFVKENAEVIENLQEEVSSLDGEHGSSGPGSPEEPQDALTPSGEGPKSVDAKALFLSDRTQEEIDALSGPDVNQLYEDAREAIESAHGGASDTYLESMTAQKMEALWKGS